MRDDVARRFLRGLAHLPLIGGGVTILGNPTGAAEPITKRLLATYWTWLEMEQRLLNWQRAGFDSAAHRGPEDVFLLNMRRGFHTGSEPPAASRAAVGCHKHEAVFPLRASPDLKARGLPVGSPDLILDNSAT